MKWIFPPIQSEKIKEIQDKLDLPKQVVNILLQRKIDKPRLIKEFLSLDLSMLHDPFLMKGMNAAVERIIKNIKKKIPIFILGDYDVDGISSITILSSFFKYLQHPFKYVIPDRFIDGYGPNIRLLEQNLDKEIDNIIDD